MADKNKKFATEQDVREALGFRGGFFRKLFGSKTVAELLVEYHEATDSRDARRLAKRIASRSNGIINIDTPTHAAAVELLNRETRKQNQELHISEQEALQQEEEQLRNDQYREAALKSAREQRAKVNAANQAKQQEEANKKNFVSAREQISKGQPLLRDEFLQTLHGLENISVNDDFALNQQLENDSEANQDFIGLKSNHAVIAAALSQIGNLDDTNELVVALRKGMQEGSFDISNINSIIKKLDEAEEQLVSAPVQPEEAATEDNIPELTDEEMKKYQEMIQNIYNQMLLNDQINPGSFENEINRMFNDSEVSFMADDIIDLHNEAVAQKAAQEAAAKARIAYTTTMMSPEELAVRLDKISGMSDETYQAVVTRFQKYEEGKGLSEEAPRYSSFIACESYIREAFDDIRNMDTSNAHEADIDDPLRNELVAQLLNDEINWHKLVQKTEEKIALEQHAEHLAEVEARNAERLAQIDAYNAENANMSWSEFVNIVQHNAEYYREKPEQYEQTVSEMHDLEMENGYEPVKSAFMQQIPVIEDAFNEFMELTKNPESDADRNDPLVKELILSFEENNIDVITVIHMAQEYSARADQVMAEFAKPVDSEPAELKAQIDTSRISIDQLYANLDQCEALVAEHEAENQAPDEGFIEFRETNRLIREALTSFEQGDVGMEVGSEACPLKMAIVTSFDNQEVDWDNLKELAQQKVRNSKPKATFNANGNEINSVASQAVKQTVSHSPAVV